SSALPTPFRDTAEGTELPVDALDAVLGGALEGLGDERRRVAGVGIAGLAESGAPLDASGRPLAPIMAWHDRRGEAQAERLKARVSTEAAGATGLPAGVPVTVAGHDHLVGAVGSGATVHDVANSVGTAETVVARSASLPDVDGALERGVAVTVFPGGDGWAVL